MTEHEYETAEEFREKLKNATIEKCPDCGCRKVDRGVDVQFEVFCQCRKCKFSWAVLHDEEPNL